MENDTTSYLKAWLNLLGGPILFFVILLLPASPSHQNAFIVIAVASWMVLWWVTETVALSITAMLPMVLFPLLGILDIKVAMAPYAHPMIFLFFGGFIIALAMEKRRLHARVALNLILITGTNANGIILGFMIATAFISMWISNTATAVMMLPMALSVIALLEQRLEDKEDIRYKRFALGLLLGIAYAANVGGLGTIIGTPPTVVFVGFAKDFYDYELDFSRWLMIGIPLTIIMVFFIYWVLTRWVYPNGIGQFSGSKEIIHKELEILGRFSKAEIIVSTVFLITATCWILRSPINGIIGSPILNDALIAMIGGILMFIIPVNMKKKEYVLSWNDTKDLPWGILFLFGGGLCLAEAMKTTGIIEVIGKSIESFQGIPTIVLVLVFTIAAVFLTELFSNLALVTIMVPISFGIADGLQINPLILGIPITIGASFAFMMPISTPPNAVVFASGHVKIKEMVRAGFILNLIGIILLTIASVTLIDWIYGADILR